MKALEEWFQEYVDKIDNEWSKSMAGQMKLLYAGAWKAALEWALSQKEIDHLRSGGSAGIIHWINPRVVEKELRE